MNIDAAVSIVHNKVNFTLDSLVIFSFCDHTDLYGITALLVFPGAYDRIHIVTEENGIAVFIVSSLVKFQTDNLFFFYPLRKKVFIK